MLRGPNLNRCRAGFGASRAERSPETRQEARTPVGIRLADLFYSRIRDTFCLTRMTLSSHYGEGKWLKHRRVRRSQIIQLRKSRWVLDPAKSKRQRTRGNERERRQ
jgi:hypothetical protein